MNSKPFVFTCLLLAVGLCSAGSLTDIAKILLEISREVNAKRMTADKCSTVTCPTTPHVFPCSASPSSPYSECICSGSSASCQEAPVTQAMIDRAVDFFKTQNRADVAQILQSGTGNIDVKNAKGRTGLNLASYKGNVDVVKVLLDRHANTEAGGNAQGVTSLMWASLGGKVDVVRVLIDRGAQIEAKTGTDDFEMTPLIFASFTENADVAKVLIDAGAQVDAADKAGDTPLCYASYAGNLDMVKLLVDNGANVNAKNTDNKTPLIYASNGGNLDVVKVLVNNGADVNVKDTDNKTALSYAIQGGFIEVADFLRSHGAM